MFIRLTRKKVSNKDTDDVSIYINTNQITAIKQGDGVTIIYTTNDLVGYFEVLESPETIYRSIYYKEHPEEDESKVRFYYVDSLDDYWIGQRIGNLYYAEWNVEDKHFKWNRSRDLRWGEQIRLDSPQKHPSEPREILFDDWFVGFMNKYYGE